jgi:hypothetical protein
LCFEVVAAIFRLRKSLEFNISISQTKVCGYKKSNYDTVSWGRGEVENPVLRLAQDGERSRTTTGRGEGENQTGSRLTLPLAGLT